MCFRSGSGLVRSSQFVYRHDVRVLELARDPRLLQETGPDRRVSCLLGAEFLQGDLATQRLVASQPDLSDAPLGVQTGECVSFTMPGQMADRRDQDVSRGWVGQSERTPGLGVNDLSERLLDKITRQPGETRLNVSLVLLELPLDEAFYVAAVDRRKPATLFEQVSHRMILVAGPESACVDELRASDGVGLQREDAEEEIAVGVGVRHRSGPRKMAIECPGLPT